MPDSTQCPPPLYKGRSWTILNNIALYALRYPCYRSIMGNAFTRETPRPQPQQQTQPRPKPLPRQLPPRPNQLLGAREELHTTPTPFRLHNWDPNFLFDNERQVLHAPQTPGTLRQLSRKPCRFFAKGHCKKGGSCTFLHENTKGREEATASRVLLI